jgi:hypothetical protein
VRKVRGYRVTRGVGKGPLLAIFLLLLGTTSLFWAAKDQSLPQCDGTEFSFARARIGMGIKLLKWLVITEQNQNNRMCIFNHWAVFSKFLVPLVSSDNFNDALQLIGAVAILCGGADPRIKGVDTKTKGFDKHVIDLAQECACFAKSGEPWTSFCPSGLTGPAQELYKKIYVKNGK